MFKHARWAVAALCVAVTATTAFAQGNGGVKPVSNSVKYKNTGVKPGTGRAGSASLDARVMIGKDGKMLVEASTGTVASGAGPGTLAKVQVKFLDITTNFNNLTAGGYWSTQFPSVGRGKAVQVQANVRGVDPKRTDVVTVSTAAALRPDIAVDSVSGPAQQMPNAMVTFIATLSEKNGDLGANANCVLSVNGAQVDAASSIWIDADDSVNCQFARTFAQPGTYTIGVSAEGVNPGDWDAANNTATTTITIVEPDKKIANGSLYAEQRDTQYQRNWNDWYYYNSYGSETQYFNRSRVQFSGSRTGGADVMQQLNATVYVNGSQAHQAALTPTNQWTYDDGYSFNKCAEYYYDYWNGTQTVRSADRASMCSGGVHGDPSNQWTNFNYERLTGTVTYYGYNQYCNYYYDWYGYYYYYCSSYTWNNQEVWGNGSTGAWTAGTKVRAKLNFMDTNAVSYTADREVTLADQSPSVNYSGSYYGWYWQEWYQSSGTLFAGSTWWNDQQ